MYTVIKGGNYESTRGTLRHCLFYISVMIAGYANRKTVTAKQAIEAGYSIVKE